MADDDRETSPETPGAIRRSWPPRRIDERLAELIAAGATFTEAAEAIYFRHIRDATQEGLDACTHLASDLRNEIDGLRIDQKRSNEKVLELAQINSLLRDEAADNARAIAELRAELRSLKGWGHEVVG